MKTILEITPLDETRYEMPDDLYEVIELALAAGSARSVKAALAGLPIELRRQVKVYLTCKPLSAGPLRGYQTNVLMVDDYAFKQEYLNEFWDEVPNDRVPPVFPDRSR